ncbi:MAG TPA: hypothetical protein VFM14_16550 [Gemmatimonadales bacterium]|nr:hypothetical protein [Gemmatimonadales bacterium]
MSRLAAVGWRLYGRQDAPPSFRVEGPPNCFVALEVVADPALLGVADLPPDRAFASWQTQATLDSPGTIELPAAAWDRLRVHPRLFYRAHSSTSSSRWAEHAVSVPDAAAVIAPAMRLCDRWLADDALIDPVRARTMLDAVADDPAFAEIEPFASVSALVLLHRFSPKRPAAPNAIEWVVVVLGGEPAGDSRTLVERRRFADGVLVQSGWISPTDSAPGAVPPLRFPAAIADGSAAWPEKGYGPFTVLQENAPAPGDEGGTRVFLSQTGVCVYRGTTAWSGAAAADIPA